MFDNFLDDRNAGPKRRSALLLTGSLMFHGLAVGALLLSSAFEIHKLVPQDSTEITFAAVFPAPPAGAGGEPKRPQPSLRKRIREQRRTVRTDAWNPDPTEVTIDDDWKDGDDGGATGTGVGSGTGPGGPGPAGSIGSCTVPPCGPIGTTAARVPATPPPPPEQEPPATNVQIEKLSRVSGEEQIRPDDATRVQMASAGVTRTQVTIKLCLDSDGRVSSVRLLKSSGFSAYDDRIRSKVRQWRYLPYSNGDRNVGVCAPVHFHYVIQ